MLLYFFASLASSSSRYDENLREIDCGLLYYDPDNTLYFGCRSQDKDQHYGQDWESLCRASVPSTNIPSTDSSNLNINTSTTHEYSRPYLTYRPAFSRDNPEGVKRTYVQDLMDEDREKVWDVVGRRGGWVYISGCVASHLFLDSFGYDILMILILVVISLGTMSWRPVWHHTDLRTRCPPPFVSR